MRAHFSRLRVPPRAVPELSEALLQAGCLTGHFADDALVVLARIDDEDAESPSEAARLASAELVFFLRAWELSRHDEIRVELIDERVVDIADEVAPLLDAA